MIGARTTSSDSATPAEASQPTFIVVGCGNTLRGDDALGSQVAQTVEAWQLPGVAAIAVHQLTPELAAALAHYDCAIFVDARSATTADDGAGSPVQVQLVQPALQDSGQTHVAAPDQVLALALALYGHCPQSWLISILAERFAFGTSLSPAAAGRQNTALLVVRQIITTQRGRHA